MSFSIVKYRDEVACDVVPMNAVHILLGRPWQFDRHVTHDGYINRYSFVLNIIPLTPRQVYEDQVRLKQDKTAKKVQKGEKK